MVTIDKIDFSKLKPYDGKATKCFEQLCYQMAQKEYGHLGTFTPIDGSGGDGGVEFYLDLTNGEKWGWQCKFYGGNGRLNESKRKQAIEGSLETACRNHSKLNKWILCLKTDLTEDSIAVGGAKTLGEQSWFKGTLLNKIPAGHSVALEHWGESAILNFLNSKNHIGIRSFFFGELEFDENWFKLRYTENFEKVKEKYDPNVHSIDKYTQSIIDFLLLDNRYIEHLEGLKGELEEKAKEINLAIEEYKSEKRMHAKSVAVSSLYIQSCEEFANHCAFVNGKIDLLCNAFKNYNEVEIIGFKIEDLTNHFTEFYDKINPAVFEEDSGEYRSAVNISNLIAEFGEIHSIYFRNYYHKQKQECHFLADPAKGKTHLSTDIAFNRIKNKKPVIFITGDKFTDESSINEALKKILDINQEYSIDDFIHALDIYGSITKAKVPIIIDGLNETTSNRFFSPIWKTHLSSFISKLLQTKNVVLITTCRISYAGRIWENTHSSKFHFLYGFEDYATIKDAIEKYFKKYQLKADLFFAPIQKFRDPIFLKIFCENKNPNWQNKTKEVEVNIDEEYSFDVFDSYLELVNKRVTSNSPILKGNESFIQSSLIKLSDYFWNNNEREIPIEDFYKLIDGNQLYQKDASKADILIHEGLVMTRDIREETEYVSFTYDILAGYNIAKNLITKNDLQYFTGKEFINKVTQGNRQHPLFEDIILSLCLLLPNLKSTALHDLILEDKKLKFTSHKLFGYLPGFIKNKFQNRINFCNYAYKKSVVSLYQLPAEYVKNSDINIVANLFLNSSYKKEHLFDLAFSTLSNTTHPLNVDFTSTVLQKMKMNERDIKWSEYIRRRHFDLEQFITEFNSQCSGTAAESDISIQKQHLASKIIVWFLTTPDRTLRDLACHALYNYGKKFPDEFSELVYQSLKFNDPYVWERTLASLYGVTMAEHNSLNSTKFRDNILPSIGKTIYKLIFAPEAPYSTTHILARDYARRAIEISLLYHPNLLDKTEVQNIRPPYKFGGLRDLGEFDYGDKQYDYSGPLQMDFSNYTIGRIVKDGGSYSNPPEKIKVRRQIYWRIYNLGWDEKLFSKAEKAIGNDSYYRGRSERPKVERYGKKYSWIAFFENAGLRKDQGLLESEWDDFRISNVDIDPSFPIKPENQEHFIDNLLGSDGITLEDWYHNGNYPAVVDNYLSVSNLLKMGNDWICLDAHINQDSILNKRDSFVFIRSFFIKEIEYEEVLALLNKQNLGGRWLPEKKENYYSFAGELYYCNDATHDNKVELDFIVNTTKRKVKEGEDGYYPNVSFDLETFKMKREYPDEIEIEIKESKDFDVYMPVMEYNWESYHSHLNNAGHMTVVSKEIGQGLKLINPPQTFDLFDSSGSRASINIHYHKNFTNNHDFVYLRKDLLDQYLSENKLKFVWAIWGERELNFRTDEEREEFFKQHPFVESQLFQKIVDYKS